MNLNDNPRGGTLCLSKAGLGIGSTATQIKIAAPNGAGIDYVIKGKVYHKADTASVATGVVDADGTAVTTQAADTACLYLVMINAAGTIKTFKGTEISVDSSGSIPENDALHYPAPDSTFCPFGVIKIVTDSVTFACGTDDFSKSGVTDTYYDLFAIPTSPET